jgi:hypothetical protein
LENDPDNLEETQFAINSYVLVKYENRDGIRPHAPPSKLHPTLRGPFKVISKTSRDRLGSIYTCQNLVTNKLEDFHVTNLQPFHWDGNTNPLEVALSDDQSFLVEDILNHRFVGNKRKIKSNLQFQIRWKGVNEPTWEPWRNCAKLQKVHQYLRVHPQLKKFAPKESDWVYE